MNKDLNQLQMRLTFNGNESFPEQEILVDDELFNFDHKLNSHYMIDYQYLVKSLSTDGELSILTCGCSVSACAGLYEGIRVSHSGSIVTWRIIEPKPVRVFRFDAVQYFIAIVQFFRAANAVKGADYEGSPGSIGHLCFGPAQFSACLQELERFGTESGLTAEANLRKLY